MKSKNERIEKIGTPNANSNWQDLVEPGIVKLDGYYSAQQLRDIADVMEEAE